VAEPRTLDPSARLRAAREKRGLSSRQVADATKLSVRAIDALERDALSELPEGIYRRSIVRAVAREVGLNPDQLLTEFTSLHPDAFPAPPSVVVVEPKAANSFNRMLTVVSAALPVIAAVVYFGVPMMRAIIGEAPKPAVVEPRRIDAVRAEVVPVGGFVEAAAPVSRPVPVVVTLTISSRCQLRVVADGTEIIGRTMEQGETVPIELGDEILLLGDNASAVQFSINGQAGRLLGEPGDVLSARIGRDDYQDFLVRY
jgi:cytoskeleton protein RodZ